MKKTVIGIVALAAATLAGLGLEAATPEKATGSSAYFHVNTSNDTVRIENVVCKYCDGEYGKGKGRNATFLKGVSLNVDFTMNAVSDDEDDPIDHYIVNKMQVDIPSFTVDVGALEVGEKFEVKAVTRNGSESKPFRVNFDIAEVPKDCLGPDVHAVEADDSVLYQSMNLNTFAFFEGLDGAFKLPKIVDAASWMSDKGATIEGAGFEWVPEFKLASVMDSSTGKALMGGLGSLGDKMKWTVFGDDKLRDLTVKGQKIGKMAGGDIKLKIEGDLISKWNPEKKSWINIDSAIGANVVVDGKVSFRFPQTLFICYVSGEVLGDEHFLIRKRNDKWNFNILGQPLAEACLEGGAGIDGCKIAVGGEVGLIGNFEYLKCNDWGWGGQLFWTIEFFNLNFGNKGLRKTDETSIDDVTYHWMHWWYKNGVKVDSVEGGAEQASAALNSAGPTKANAAKLLAAGPRLLAAAAVEPEPCNPQPALAMRGGVDALCFLTSATARSASDRSMLVCRMGSDGAWGAVETLWDDGTADLSPSVGVAADGTVIAAWVNLKGAVGEPTHLTELTRKMEIAVGVRNPSTGAWTCRNLTADDQVDFSPRVAVAADGTAYVAWCANGDNAFYGSNTVVKCAAFADGAWGSVTSLGRVGSVNGLAAACQGANGAIVCTVEDGDAHRVRCFEVAGGRVSQSATVECASWAENPDVAYDAAGVAQFHWLQEGALRTKSGFAAGGDAVAEGVAGVTVPHGTAYLKGPDGVQGLVWQEAPKTDGSQNGVMLMARDASGKWQAPATLWIPEERARAFSGAYADDGTLRLAYESARGSRDNKGVMRYGAATLRTFELDGGVDVSVTANEIGVEGGRLFYGAANEFFATIHNLGRTDAVNVPIKFVAAANGTDFEFYSAVTNIAAGGSVCVTSEWTVAQGYTNLCFKVLLDPDQTIAERNRANNAAEWRSAAGSLAIADERFVRETRNVCQVNAKVVTDGALVIPEGTVVEYRRGGLEGALLGTDTLGEIVPGKGYATGFRWDMSSTTFADAWETVYLAIRGNDHAMTAVRVLATLDTDGDGAFDGEEEMAGTDPRDPTSKPDDAGGGSGGGDEIRRGTVGLMCLFDLVADLGIAIDADYAAGDKVAVKVETLPKGLKLVATPVYADPTAKKKVVVGYTYAIAGVPTETLDFETTPMFVRVAVTKKDPVTGKSATTETLQRAALAVEAAVPRKLEGVMNADLGIVDATSLWPELTARWTFKGWPAGVRYTAKPVAATRTAPAIPAFSIYGRPTKAGVFTVTATTPAKEQFFLAFTVWPSETERAIRYTHQAYTDVLENLGTAVTAASGLPTGLKFTAKDIAATTRAAAQSAGDVCGRPTKPGVYAVQLTLRDPSDPTGRRTLKEKETFLWKVTDGENPGLGATEVGWAAGDAAWDGGAATATVRQGAAVDLGVDLGALDATAKVTVSGLPSGLRYDAKTGRVTGVATKAERKVVTVKVVQNGVTVIKRFAVETAANPFTGTFVGAAAARPAGAPDAAVRLAVAEVKADAGGRVALTYTEGGTKYTASAKSYAYDLKSGLGSVTGLLLKVSSDDKKAGFGNRVADLVLEDRGLYGRVTLAVRDESGEAFADSRAVCHEVVKAPDAAPDALQTCVFAVAAGEPLATVSAAYDAKKATAAFAGRLFDTTAVKATAAVCRRSDETGDVGDYVFAPFLVIGRDKTVYRVEWPADAAESATVRVVGEAGETDAFAGAKTVCPVGDRKLAEVVADTGALSVTTPEAGVETFAFVVTRDARGNPSGVAVYDADAAEGERPLATVTAKLGRATGGVSLTFTSKKGDKAKYAVDLVWQGDGLLGGQVVRTWKDGRTPMTAYGVAELK